MSEHQVDIKIKAADESTSTFQKVASEHTSAFHRLTSAAREFNLEARHGGDQALERLFKGGGAIGIASLASESLIKVAKSLHEVQAGTLEWGEAVTKTAESLPFGVGKAVEAFNGLGQVVNDYAASLYREHGASEEYIEQEVEDAETVKHKYEELNKVIDGLGASLRKYRNEARLSDPELKGSHKAEEEEAVKHEEKLAEIRKGEREKLGELEKAGVQKNSSAYRNVKKQFEAEAEAAEQTHQNRLKEIHDRAAEKAGSAEAEHQIRMGEFADHAETAQLKASGAALAAELSALQAANAKMEAEQRRHLEEMNRNATPEERAKNTANAEAEIAARRKGLGDQTKDLMRKDAEERAKLAREAADKLKDTEAEIRAEQLRAVGKEFEARRVEVNRQLERENALIAEKLREQFSPEKLQAAKAALDDAMKHAKSKEERSAIQSAGDQFFAAADAAAREAHAQQGTNAALARQKLAGVGRDESNAQSDAREQARKALVEIRLGFLKDEAEMGNKATEVEAKRLEIAEKYTQKAAEIHKLLRDGKGLSDADRKALQGQLAGLDAMQAQELAKAGKSSFTKLSAPGLASEVESTGTRQFSGLAVAATEQQALLAAERKDVSDPTTHTLLQQIVQGVQNLAHPTTASKPNVQSVFGH